MFFFFIFLVLQVLIFVCCVHIVLSRGGVDSEFLFVLFSFFVSFRMLCFGNIDLMAIGRRIDNSFVVDCC